jgi:energy-coupling factor transport system permease protein
VRAAALARARVFGLLVATVRRAAQLATAMDARGFDSGTRRSSARVSRVRRRDLLVVVGALAGVAVATATSVALGTWRPLL